MDIQNLPHKIRKKIKNMEIERVSIGHSAANVYKCTNNTENYFLKIDSKNKELYDEHQNIKWLQNKAPVPNIVEWDSDEKNDYLLISKINGYMLCDNYYSSNPGLAISVLSKGINLLHSMDITDCKIINNLDKKLSMAETNIQNELVDINDWNENTLMQFSSPKSLLKYLYNNRPKTEELVFTHGDYCLPNIFGIDDKITGFIDLGRAGVSDKWQDIALCIRSLRYNFKTNEYDNFLFEELKTAKDIEKMNYYILLDELF